MNANSERSTTHTIGIDDEVELWHGQPGKSYRVRNVALLISEDGTLIGAELDLERPSTDVRSRARVAYAAQVSGLAPIGPPIRLTS